MKRWVSIRFPSPQGEGRIILVAPLLALLVVACTPTPPPRAETYPPGSQLARGHAVYERWCAACHDPGPEHPGTLAMIAKYGDARPSAIEDWTDLPPGTTKLIVRQGVYTMSFFRPTEISDSELEDLAAYLARHTR